MRKLRFIDLFAGLGGFHIALRALGHECVFACERDGRLAKLYEKNFGVAPHRDIRALDLGNIPAHDIMCAGFPCQPFSKAGGQQGFECPQWGDLFDYLVRNLKLHAPEFFIIENVPNLIGHQEGETWRSIIKKLKGVGDYEVDDAILSPHQFGVPQVRKRAFIVGRRGGLEGFTPPVPVANTQFSLRSILDRNPDDAKPLSSRYIAYLDAWQEFLDRYPADEELPSFPIWAMEFGATYPYRNRSPYSYQTSKLRYFKGIFGESLRNLAADDIFAALPPYAREKRETFPEWKIDFIRKNRDLYKKNKKWIDDWLPRIRDFAPSFQKLEWNCKGDARSVWKHVIQFRASGIRVRRPVTAPSLIAMTTSQVPVIAWERRYMTIRECSRLQSMESLAHLPEPYTSAFRALGNAVNVEVVRALARELLSNSELTPAQQRLWSADKEDGDDNAADQVATAAA